MIKFQLSLSPSIVGCSQINQMDSEEKEKKA
uniref:Lipoprotein n=1 Tax=Strongyloides stercoralis TaxID=6248 RepID=A0A0K0ELM8_STRER